MSRKPWLVEVSKEDEEHRQLCIVYGWLQRIKYHTMAERIRMVLDGECKARMIDLREGQDDNQI
jgi:hypothetical protein